MTNTAWYFLVLMLGCLVIPQLGKNLEWLLNLLAPRRWREARLPAPIDKDNHARAMTLMVLGIGGLLLLFERPLSDLAGREYRPIALSVFVVVLAVLAWGLAHLKHWWLLEPGCPLRTILDSLTHGTGVRVGRVRLRDSNSMVPRVFLDGAMELSTEFIRKVTPSEQAFLLAAALHHRKTRQPLCSLVGWCLGVVGGPVLIYVLLAMLQVSWGYLSIPFGLYFAGVLLYGPKCELETLKFALGATGDLEAAKRAVRRVDGYNAEKRLDVLRQWWEKQQPAAPATVVPMTSTVQPIEQQTLGRKP